MLPHFFFDGLELFLPPLQTVRLRFFCLSKVQKADKDGQENHTPRGSPHFYSLIISILKITRGLKNKLYFINCIEIYTTRIQYHAFQEASRMPDW